MKPYRRPERKSEDRVIVVEPDPFGVAIGVRVDPPLPSSRDYNHAFLTHEAARSYAGQLRARLRLPILDRAGDE